MHTPLHQPSPNSKPHSSPPPSLSPHPFPSLSQNPSTSPSSPHSPPLFPSRLLFPNLLRPLLSRQNPPQQHQRQQSYHPTYNAPSNSPGVDVVRGHECGGGEGVARLWEVGGRECVAERRAVVDDGVGAVGVWWCGGRVIDDGAGGVGVALGEGGVG